MSIACDQVSHFKQLPNLALDGSRRSRSIGKNLREGEIEIRHVTKGEVIVLSHVVAQEILQYAALNMGNMAERADPQGSFSRSRGPAGTSRPFSWSGGPTGTSRPQAFPQEGRHFIGAGEVLFV